MGKKNATRKMQQNKDSPQKDKLWLAEKIKLIWNFPYSQNFLL